MAEGGAGCTVAERQLSDAERLAHPPLQWDDGLMFPPSEGFLWLLLPGSIRTSSL